VSQPGEAAGNELRWRPRAFLLLGAAGFLLIVAVVERNAVPVFVAVPLLLAGPAAALAGPRGSPRLAAVRSAEGSGPIVRLTGAVATPARVDSRDLLVPVDCPSGLTPVAGPVFERHRTEVRFEATWRAREPTIVLVPSPRVIWRDAVGLVERSATTDLPDLVIERYPPELLRVGAVRLRRTMVLPGETLSSHLGTTGEFYGIRDALPTDPPRRINWAASARHGRWLANEFRVERTGDVVLVIDARRTSMGPRSDERLLSLSRAAALGIAQSFLRVKARVGLAVFGEFLTAVPLATGRTQEERIRRTLMATRLSYADAPSERGAIALSRYFPPGITTVLLSSLVDEPIADLLPHLRRRGFPVIALSPSPLPIDLEAAALPADEEAIVARISRLVRRDQIARAWQEAPTIDWDDYWSLGPFVEFLRRPTIRRWG
jgi:uncharacterized protein (DUF58 family)